MLVEVNPIPAGQGGSIRESAREHSPGRRGAATMLGAGFAGVQVGWGRVGGRRWGGWKKGDPPPDLHHTNSCIAIKAKARREGGGQLRRYINMVAW